MSLKFSVIIPVYNVEKYVAKCLDSVINQNYDNLEVIIVDDASTDNSYNICLRYAEQYPNIRLFSKEGNEGLGAARISGIKMATGDYIAFIDSDDYYEPNLFSTVNDMIKSYVYDIVEYSFRGINLEGKTIYTTHFFSATYTGMEGLEQFIKVKNAAGYVWNKVYARHLFEPLPPAFRYMEDNVFNVVAYTNAKTVKVISDVFYNYLNRQDSLQSSPMSIAKLDSIKAREFQYNFVKNHNPSLSDHVAFKSQIENISHYSKALFDKRLERNTRKVILSKTKEAFKYFNKAEMVKSNYFSEERIAIVLFMINPFICSLLLFLKRKKRYYCSVKAVGKNN